MKKRLLAVLLTLCMVITLLPTVALADGETEAVTTPGQLATALESATPETTVTLGADITITGDTTLDLKGATINTAGHTITIQSGTTTVTGNGTVKNAVEGVKSTKTPHSLFSVDSGATLTVENGTFQSAGYQPFYVKGTLNFKDGTIKITVENSKFDGKSVIAVNGANAELNMPAGTIQMTDSDPTGDSGMYGIYAFSGATVTLGDESAKTGPTINSHFAALGQNATTAPASWKVYGGTYKMTANGSDSGSDASWKYFCGVMYLSGPTTVDIYGGTFTGTDYALCFPWANSYSTVNISGGEFTYNDTTNTDTDGLLYFRTITSTKVVQIDENKNQIAVNISDGKLNGGTLVRGYEDATSGEGDLAYEKYAIKVTGGIFSADPSDYCAEGLTGVANTDTDTQAVYPFMVGEASETPAEAKAAAPVATITRDLSGADKELAESVETALSGATITGSSLEAAAATMADANEVTEDAGKAALEAENVDLGDKEVSIVLQYYMDVKITDASSENNTITLDITPMAQTVATIADDDAIITKDVAEKSDTVNAVKIGEAKKLTVTGPVTITIPLPNDFTDKETLNVKHVKDNGKTYIYTGEVATAEDGSQTQTLTFTNPHGFSSFEIGTKAAIVATIGTTGYTSLQAAVDEVEDGGTIAITEDNNENITVSKNITFTVSGGHDTALRAGSSYTMTKENGTYTFTYVPSEGATAKYAVSVTGSAGGTVTASAQRAAEGTEVVLTVTPDTGKALSALNVTDKNGADVAVTENADGTYSFTMPASKATIKATFTDANAAEKPEENCPAEAFTDVDTGKWYHEAVDYVLEKGIMEGNSNGTFTPDKYLTRAQLAQILYNAAGKPEVTVENTFTDVAADKWYATAVTWAAQAGVVEGNGDGTFSPDVYIKRQDLAVMLWRYAGKPEATLTSLSFTDAAEASDYAQAALLWAAETGIVEGNNGKLSPKGNATRAQAATMIMRYLELG